MTEQTVRFSTLDPSTGKESDVRYLGHSAIRSCPTLIFLPGHYRTDGTCRHDEPNCEEQDCQNPKANGEIFCTAHLDEY